MTLWLKSSLLRLAPLTLALLAGVILAAGLRRSGERAARVALEAQRCEEERRHARDQALAVARFRHDGALERLRRGDY